MIETIEKSIIEKALAETRQELGKEHTGMRMYQARMCEKLNLRLLP